MKHSSSEWETEYERSGFVRSPDYDRSIAYFRKFVTATSNARMHPIGTTPQGRTIQCLVVAGGKEFTPQKASKSGKAVVVIQNGIHAGEIEGKDACMLLLRDILITKEKIHLLKHLILLVIPVLNADGHERTGEFNRPNQNGPEEMGWRTNSCNLNLNRDFMKADAPETRAFLRLFRDWRPDFFIDNHTTNGADYQYHVTYALEKNGNIDPELAAWGQEHFLKDLISTVENEGFLTAPYIQFKRDTIESGIIDPPALPRFSTGYTAAQNRLGLLVETHSLKPYQNRVRSTYSMNAASLEFLNQNYAQLIRLNKKADRNSAQLQKIPLHFALTERSIPFQFKALQTAMKQSSITGNVVPQYGTEPVTTTIPYYGEVVPGKECTFPAAYLIPPQFGYIREILDLHGIVSSVLATRKRYTVTQYKFEDVRFNGRPYEGRQLVEVRCMPTRKEVVVPAGTIVIKTGQRTNRVLVGLLEPESPDSFVSWGFFNAFFERKEYAEAYVMEPIAQQMLEKDPLLRQEFEERLLEESFRRDPAARLDFFYTRSPYFDSSERMYPIYRLEQ